MHHIPIIFLISAALLSLVTFSQSARILGVFPFTSRSHQNLNQPIMRTLAKKGHQVTIVSHFKTPPQLENYTELTISDNSDNIPSLMDSVTADNYNQLQGISNVINFIHQMENCEPIFRHPFIQAVINSKKKLIDLLLVEEYSLMCYNLLAEKLDIPVITIQAPCLNPGNDFMLGSTNNPAYVPIVSTSYTTHMTLYQRLWNTIFYVQWYWFHYSTAISDLENIAHKYLGMDELPPINVLERRVAVSFHNNHHSIISKPASPNVINTAGIHIKPAKPLSKKLQTLIDNSNHGVIFFSFGSSFRASSMSPATMKAFRKVFSRIPQTVIWRADPKQIDMPENVYADTWLPQRDILEHKNVKAFISHCGLLSTEEAMVTSTPIIGIPFFFDQIQVANLLVEKEVGIKLDFESLTEKTLSAAIENIINNTKYMSNMKELSSVFNDRIVSPIEEAIFWVEFVLRHNGASHLRTSGADLPLYQYLLLDVIAVIIISIISIMFISFWFIRETYTTFKNSLFNYEEDKLKTN